jgi:hypothetical protein
MLVQLSAAIAVIGMLSTAALAQGAASPTDPQIHRSTDPQIHRSPTSPTPQDNSI